MKFLLQYIFLSSAIFFTHYRAIGQIKPAVLQIKFEKPQVQANSIKVENGSFPFRKIVLDSTTTRTDSAGIAIYTFSIRKSGVRNIAFFQDSIHWISIDFFLRPGEKINCTEKGGKFIFDGDDNAAKLNRFLREIGILSTDSLRQKPLMRKVADDLYANFMRDIADEKWHLYQTTQDTTDTTQNIFVKAALEAQQYQRVQFFVQTKDWTDDMFYKIKDRTVGRQQRFFIPNNETTYRPHFRIVPHEDAILSSDYLFSLTSYLGGNLNYFNQRNNLSEKVIEFYDAIDRELRRLPRTRETLIASILRNNYWNDTGSQGLVERFERDFPHSKHLKEVRYNHWSMKKVQTGALIPPVPMLKSDSTQTPLKMSKGSPTLVLIWNTWEDSCQTALSSIAAIAKKYEKSGVRFMTLCVRNRFESWKEVLMCHWPNHQKDKHFYADYPETDVLEGIFTKKRPMIAMMDEEGKFIEQFSPFETAKIDKWLKK